MGDDNRGNDDHGWGDRYRHDREPTYGRPENERRYYGAGDFEYSRQSNAAPNRPRGWEEQHDDDRSYRNFGGWDAPFGGHPLHRDRDRDRRFDRRDNELSWDRLAHEGRSFIDKARDEVSSWFSSRTEPYRDEGYRGEAYRSEPGQGTHRGRGPRGYRRSDERIREDVSDRLTEDAWLDASDIEVSVQAGEVTLSGTVRQRADKRRAEDAADHVSGVTHVQNNLRVGGEEPANYAYGDMPPMI